MSAKLAVPRMSVEEFLDWTDRHDGKFELEDGLVVAMAPERIVHSRAKLAAVRSLADAIAKAGLPCEAFMEGPGVRIDAATSYQPDAVVQCGPRLAGDVRFIDVPVIVVEILSPSTAYRDLGRKARNYFRVSTIAHYLIVDAEDRIVTHHRRAEGGAIITMPLDKGDLTLDPPGLTVTVQSLLPLVETSEPA